MCCSAEENEDLIMSQSESSIMYYFAEERKALIRRKKMNASESCSIAIQNNLNKTDNAVLKSARIHKCFNSKLIQNDIMILSFVDFAS